MPTFTAITLDRLLEPGSRNPAKKPPPVPVRLEKPPLPEGAGASGNKKIPLPYASPTLYATPETTPLPDSPSSFPPSPYIINHKRRGPRLLKSFSQSDVGGCQKSVDATQKDEALNGGGGEEVANMPSDGNDKGEQKTGDEHRNQVEGSVGSSHDGNLSRSKSADGLIGLEESVKSLAADSEIDGERDDFFDPQDSMSIASNISSNAEVDEPSWKPTTPHGEYFDAFEEIYSDGTPQSSRRDILEELSEIRLNLLMEIEKRKQAEESLENLQNQWQRLSHQLSQVGLKLPAPPPIIEEKDEQSDIDPVEELSQQVVIARLVAGAVGRACSRAEVEMQMEPLIESKNFEIARLWDRLHYYEVANSEMSQRNQEAVEMARQQRHRRKRRQKWFWSSIGIAITLGAAAIAWSYLPVPEPSSHDDDAAASHEQ